MSECNRASRLRLLLLLASLACVPVTPAADAAAPIPRSQNLTLNLIRRLVQRGVLPQSDADDLIKLAEEDTAAAKAEATAQPTPSGSATTVATTHAPAPSDTVRVTYVPEFVKKQIREEVKQDVLAQARAERWAAPRSFPEWVSRYTLFGDVRLRYEGLFFPSGSDNTGAFPNFNAINTGSPFDVAGTVFSPQYNVDQTRYRPRLRARVGASIDLEEGFTSGLRLATGENNNPVTASQSLGVANGAQGGNFSKYAVWLDRAFIKYDAYNRNVSATIGRFDNPFFATNLIWSDDLGFDGAVVKAKRQLAPTLVPFVTAGAFPVFNTDLNFSNTQPAKFKSEDKWLYAAQVGIDWSVNHDFSAKLGAAYYDFQNIEGKLSDPFTPVTSSDAGDTDDSRPAFAQSGNTYMALRNIVPNVLNNFGAINQWQYFGLATPFRDVALTARLDYNQFAPFQISLQTEVIQNTAFHRGLVAKKAVNNLGAAGAGAFVGGNNAWMVGLRAGAVALEKRWDWNTSLTYKYVASDSVVDGFDDADFGGTRLGTNLKGYILGGNLALSRRVWLSLRWMSADSVSGPVFKNDLFQFDFNGKF